MAIIGGVDVKIFISSPLRGPTDEIVLENRKRAEIYCRKVYELGLVPMAPHVYLPHFLDVGNAEHEAFAEVFSAMWIRDADAVWVFDENGISEGMKSEIDYAKACNVPVLYQSLKQLALD